MPRQRVLPDKFTWHEGDITLILPEEGKIEQTLPEELHTILWALEHVTNRESYETASMNAAMYVVDHLEYQTMVGAALERAEQRIENAT